MVDSFYDNQHRLKQLYCEVDDFSLHDTSAAMKKRFLDLIYMVPISSMNIFGKDPKDWEQLVLEAKKEDDRVKELNEKK